MLPILACVAASCHAAPPVDRNEATASFAPAATRTLRSFGALGDGRSDDTGALARALDQSDRQCLDGERRTYRVTGTLRVTKNLCLRNARLVQARARSTQHRSSSDLCPIIRDATAVIDCGDPTIPPAQLDRLQESLSVRTCSSGPATAAIA